MVDNVFAVLCMLTLIAIKGVQGSHKVFPEFQTLLAVDLKQSLRTGYHFQPPKNWINDPNAPMYVNGFYHLFYQYNPKGAVWGNIVWAHSVSTDLINWHSLPIAISPSKWYDINGCWSGSATVLPHGRPVIMYTGVDRNTRQVQAYAVPKNLSDPYLREWVKPDINNPFIDPDPIVNASAFRDPTTAWFVNGIWKMTVGSRRGNRGVAYLYRSRDFVRWRRSQHPLHSKEGTGLWECPDFYPVSSKTKDGMDTSALGRNVKHAFKVSLDDTRYDYYTLGRYDTLRDRYYPDPDMVDGWAGLRYDYGNFYASKSFYDPVHKRRVLWGWANESDWVLRPVNDVIKGWAGIQLIPREVWLDRTGKQLVQWPIKELESLRKGMVEKKRLKLPKGGYVEVRGITTSQADVEVVFSFSSLERAERFEEKWNNENVHELCALKGAKVGGGIGPFGLMTLASSMHEEYTPVFFRVYKGGKGYKVLMCSDAGTSSLAQNLYRPTFGGLVDMDLSDKKISLRSLIDHSVVESFGAEGKVVISSRVYPTMAVSQNAHLYVFNNGEETVMVDHLRAWSMKSPAFMNKPLEE